MFSNKFFYPRIAILSALILGGFVYSYKAGKFINPAFWICQLQPERFNGKELWVPYTVIETIEDGSFTIDTGGHKIRISGRMPFRAGDKVALTGKFVADKDGCRIILTEIRKLGSERTYPSLASVAIFVVVIFLFVREFKPGWRGLMLK